MRAGQGFECRSANPLTHFREASWDEALDVAAKGLIAQRDVAGTRAAGFGSAKCSKKDYLFQKFIRQGFGHNNVDHCTAYVMRRQLPPCLKMLDQVRLPRRLTRLKMPM